MQAAREAWEDASCEHLHTGTGTPLAAPAPGAPVFAGKQAGYELPLGQDPRRVLRVLPNSLLALGSPYWFSW